ncbi:MAG TPA: ATP-binding cassette domain-containing protein [bacterium]|nr:ATP-binding cassette domain-containing protein [bacterium]HOL47382.1 ATP-binding cassette domain-containing protein [bacterium]HPQ18119.1 ATP-binding cassette domain-containing protein [bacterium]
MIQFKNVNKKFNNKVVLKNLNLDVRKGETLVIIGQSGTGKSVLLKCLLRLMEVDSGSIIVKGIDIVRAEKEQVNAIRKNIGMLFQSGALFDFMTIYENVSFFIKEHKRIKKEEIDKIVKEKLALVNLSNTENLLPAELSGGMKKRASLARAIAIEPEIILYDEPTTGLDPITANTINNLIIDMQNKLKVTSIVVTHDMNSAFKVGDRIAMLYQGEIIEIGTTEEIKNTKNQFVQKFIRGE